MHLTELKIDRQRDWNIERQKGRWKDRMARCEDKKTERKDEKTERQVLKTERKKCINTEKT